MATANKETQEYLDKLERAFQDLCDAAKAKSELQYIMALCPEFRGSQDPGWCTWEETCKAFDEYMEFIESGDKTTPIKVRVALSFYCHLSEASGFYECPKNLLRIAGGESYRMWPFIDLNRTHSETGKVIAPNANKVFRDLIGHAQSLGLTDLAESLRDAFDPDIRNGYAHADYIIWSDGLRLRRQAGGHPRVVPWDEFDQALFRAINIFSVIRETIKEKLMEYRTPKKLIGNLGAGPDLQWEVKMDDNGRLSLTSSVLPPTP
jgi:hypothetical protein